ncbi:Brp/Blh family beta-carotene 15,15'-dioxygenase, partial [Enterococcus sp. HPCN18]|uniref:Brp/Blh family beta-carotene 15,15'-dioxygenase n=1 Tax=Enterococcus sp. HPCN18 TaxID=2248751 RepID=UPI001C65826C
VSLICLAWWSAFPAIALPLFLIASALHFAAEEAAAISRLQRGALGGGVSAIPAVLHPRGYEALLTLAGGMPVPSPVLAALIAAG